MGTVTELIEQKRTDLEKIASGEKETIIKIYENEVYGSFHKRTWDDISADEVGELFDLDGLLLELFLLEVEGKVSLNNDVFYLSYDLTDEEKEAKTKAIYDLIIKLRKEDAEVDSYDIKEAINDELDSEMELYNFVDSIASADDVKDKGLAIDVEVSCKGTEVADNVLELFKKFDVPSSLTDVAL